MSRLLLLPLLVLAAVLPFVESLVAQPPPKPEVAKGKKIAVLVGVNGYLNKPFENLKYAEQDMTDLKVRLTKAGFDVILLLGSEAGDKEASRANIAAVLLDKREDNPRYAFRDVTGEDDQVLVAFSGHGEQIEVLEKEDGGKAEKREVPFFCPKRAESGTPSTMVSMNEVLKTFNGGKAKALLLVDACRSFAENREGTKGAVIDRKRVDSLRPNVGGMFAASDRQAAREHEKAGTDGHGLFFQAVLEAMDHEKCRDRDGNVVWSRMTDEIGDTVTRKSKELFPKLRDDEHQVPQPFGGFPRKFVLAAAVAPPGAERKGGEEVEFAVADGVKMRFCWIPPGESQLGSPKTERDAVMKNGDYKEEPEWLKAEAEVVRGKYMENKGFWLAKYPVTQAEWTAVMGTVPFAFRKDGEGADRVKGMDTSRFPAEQVSWDDAQELLGKVNGRAGVAGAFGKGAKLVLPHEDRWEYAYRGGKAKKPAYYWGEALSSTEANCDGNYPFGTTDKEEYLKRPTKVGAYESKTKHPWGLCDMSGNVYQWCDNKYSNESQNRVLRGGTWSSSARNCRAATRFFNAPVNRGNTCGFRVCVVLD